MVAIDSIRPSRLGNVFFYTSVKKWCCVQHTLNEHFHTVIELQYHTGTYAQLPAVIVSKGELMNHERCSKAVAFEHLDEYCINLAVRALPNCEVMGMCGLCTVR